MITANTENLVLNIPFYESWNESEVLNFEYFSQGAFNIFESMAEEIEAGVTDTEDTIDVSNPIFNLFKRTD